MSSVTRFRLCGTPTPRYQASRQVSKFLWYLNNDWSEVNARWLGRRLESVKYGDSYGKYEKELESYPGLIDRLTEMYVEYERLRKYFVAHEKRKSEAELKRRYERVVRGMELIRARVEGRARLRYKSAAWQARYIKQSLDSDPQWQKFCQEKASLPDYGLYLAG